MYILEVFSTYFFVKGANIKLFLQAED